MRTRLDKPLDRKSVRLASKRGSTLVEVMMSSIIILVVLLAGFGALIQGNRLIEVSLRVID